MKSVLLAAVLGAAFVAPAFAADPICDPLKKMTDAAKEQPVPFASLAASPPVFEGAAAPCAKVPGEDPKAGWRCQLLEFQQDMNENSKPDKVTYNQNSSVLAEQAMNIAAQINTCLGETWVSEDEPPTTKNGMDATGALAVYSSQGILWRSPDGVGVRIGIGGAVGGGHAARWASLIVLKE